LLLVRVDDVVKQVPEMKIKSVNKGERYCGHAKVESVHTTGDPNTLDMASTN
jgi:hypothetical protein